MTHRTEMPAGASLVTLCGCPEGPDCDHWLQRSAVPSLPPGRSLGHSRLHHLFGSYFGAVSHLQSAPPQLTRAHMLLRQTAATPALLCPLLPLPDRSGCKNHCTLTWSQR